MQKLQCSVVNPRLDWVQIQEVKAAHKNENNEEFSFYLRDCVFLWAGGLSWSFEGIRRPKKIFLVFFIRKNSSDLFSAVNLSILVA